MREPSSACRPFRGNAIRGVKEDVDKLKERTINNYNASAFNVCTHQRLPHTEDSIKDQGKDIVEAAAPKMPSSVEADTEVPAGTLTTNKVDTKEGVVELALEDIGVRTVTLFFLAENMELVEKT